MNKKRIIMLALYLSCVVAFIVFSTGIASVFSQMQMRGFDLSEYWQLAIFGFVPSLAVSVYALIMLTSTVIKLAKERRQSGENGKNPLKRAKTDDDWPSAPQEGEVEELVAEAGDEATLAEMAEADDVTATDLVPADDAVIENAEPTVQAVEGKDAERPRRLSLKERRRQRLLEDEKPKRKTNGAFGVFLVCASLVVSCWFSVWAYAPNELCFHMYSYSETNAPADEDEVIRQNYRFYQDALGRPYCIQEASAGTRKFRVTLKSKTRGSDENGKYVLYTFDAEERYAKAFDCAVENFSYLTVNLEVYYYKKDARIVVNNSAIVRRNGKEAVLNLTRGKIYTYKKMNN